ncbi:MAG: prepilin peptidase [Candidatus Adiutrix sp.]|jgi:leader peptidase (prepilin peptidase)/N-methyltransferase|nr:prepilin peptidase [Candidatus Adiutrix sp.]
MTSVTAGIYAYYVLIAMFGLSVGSFLNVVIYRLPREGLRLARPSRSFCPVCGATIRWFDNIPVLSWLVLKGRCRDCGQPIAVRYPLVELAGGLLALYLFWRFGPSVAFILYYYFVICLLAIALIDLELMVIPDVLTYPAVAAGILCAVADPSVSLTGIRLWAALEPSIGGSLTSLAGSLLGLGFGWASLKLVSIGYKLARGHEGMGDGDPPLLGLIGSFLGWTAILPVILCSTLIGLFCVGLMMLRSRGQAPPEGWAQKPLPFGPFLALAALLYLFWGPGLLDWYWSLMSY